MKLAVEVVEASDLMSKDGRGASSPFVEVDFAGQRRRTVTIFHELNPIWNDTLLFAIRDPANLRNQTIVVSVYHDKAISTPYVRHRNFLGRVRISGAAVASSPADALLQRYPLDKRFLFSNIRGNIALRIYLLPDPTPADPAPADPAPEKESHKPAMKKPRVFFPVPEEEKTEPTQATNKAQAAPPPAGVMQMPLPESRLPQPNYGLVETSQPLAGQLGYRRPRYYLYVKVVKARDLPSKDLAGSLDPYVEVKLGDYKGVTKTMEKNQSPVWNQAFAFFKDRLQANLLEVTVKDKDVKDDFVGRMLFDLADVPLQVPPDSLLAPQWYRLEDSIGDQSNRGEIMLAVWMGTQADEAFPEAWHSDAHTRSKVYFSPELTYLCVHIIEAQDLVPGDNSRPPQTYVKVQLGNQLRRTRPSPARSVNPTWSEELMLVASEPYDEPLVITVEDHIGQGKDEPLGRLVLPVSAVQKRGDRPKLVEAQWFNLSRPTASSDEGEKRKETKFSSKIHLRVYLDTGYHVLDESTDYSSDFRPANKKLRKSSIGILELSILGARNLIAMKARDGGTTDPYCVAKYGPKWVRTRTLLHTVVPWWNEQCTWEVFDPCTVVTVGVFDNRNTTGSGSNSGSDSAQDRQIGKVQIRLSTLEADRMYTHYYPLLVLLPSGLKKTGELYLAVRFTCTAWVNMVTLYAKPLLPKMHYVLPIPVLQLDCLRHQAMQIVCARFARAEPPLRREVVEYMLDVDSHMWSFRRSKANFFRIMAVLSGAVAIAKWFDGIRNWKNPVTTILVHVLFLIIVCYPELILPMVFLYLFMIGIWNYRLRSRHPSHIDTKLSLTESAHPDELDEEFDTFPTSVEADLVRMRYDRLRSVAGRVQTVMGNLATQGERALALLSRRDPRATAIFTLFALIFAVFLLVMPFHVIVMLVGMYLLRHPKFRTKMPSKMPSVQFNIYSRLSAESDMNHMIF